MRSGIMRRLPKLLSVFAVFGMATAISAAPDAAAPVAGTGSANVPPAKVLTVAEMNTAAANITVRLDDDLQQVMHLQDIAKKAKDVIKLNCVNDRLVQIKAQRNIADETHAQLMTALQKNSDERIELYSSLNGIAENVHSLHEQAKACIGEPDLLKQESGVTVEKPEIPDDPVVLQPPDDYGIEPPGYASPWD